jgi:hypothetical protein
MAIQNVDYFDANSCLVIDIHALRSSLNELEKEKKKIGICILRNM